MTEHALLVPCGRFATEIGLIDALNRVPFGMKTVQHSPGDKLNQLLVHILAGGMHVKELQTSPHPLVQDQTVAEAWGQQSFASASGVSDLLRATSSESVATLQAELRQVMAPYRRSMLRDLSPSHLVVDFDLTGLVVSDQATSYEGADFGFMGEVGRPARGYQFARAQLAGPQGPFVLGGFLHPGHCISRHCLEELVALVEAELGRPRRRLEALEQRLGRVERELAELQAQVAKGKKRRHPRGKSLAEEVEAKREEVAQLQARCQVLGTENLTNPHPRRILLRLDGGFGDADLLAWLYEQGYDFVARAHSHRVAARLCQEEGLVWEKVSKNGFVAQSSSTVFGSCPYPMRLFVCKQWRGEQQPERWSALVVNPELEGSEWPARRVGVFYNQRQVAEASIKESKGVFASRHLPTRHQAGIALYEQLVLLAQNLVRWFHRHWLGDTVLAAVGVKELVKIGANSRALVCRCGEAIAVHFATDSPWRGITLFSKPPVSYQLWFPFLEHHLLAQARQ